MGRKKIVVKVSTITPEARYLAVWCVAREQEEKVVTRSGKCVKVSISSKGTILFVGDELTDLENTEVCTLVVDKMPCMVDWAKEVETAYQLFSRKIPRSQAWIEINHDYPVHTLH